MSLLECALVFNTLTLEDIKADLQTNPFTDTQDLFTGSASPASPQSRSPRSQKHGICERRIAPASRAVKSKIDLLEPARVEFGEEQYASVRTYFVSNSSHFQGNLVVTNYKVFHFLAQMVFVPKSKDFFRISRISHKFFKIPIYLVSRIEKQFEKKVIDSFFVDIFTKDRRHLRFSFLYDQFPVGNDITLTLFRACFPTATRIKKELFTYEFRMKYELKHQGWNVYDVIKEFKRQGLQGLEIQEQQKLIIKLKGGMKKKKATKHPLPSPEAKVGQRYSHASGDTSHQLEFPFRITRANQEFRLSWSYPQILVVPRKITDQNLIHACQFRTKERFPVLTWYSARYGTSLWRSSQCKSGMMTNRSSQDQSLLFEIANTLQARNKAPSLMVYDARSYMAAFGNRLAGKGFENKHVYKNVDVVFCDIDNMHAVRDAYKKLHKVYNNPSHKFLSHLENSGWLQTLSSIIQAALNASHSLRDNKCVLVHCSDGWDRTPQVCSLVQIILDPYYRTLEGFEVLIQKEWVSFGYQFSKRCGHATRDTNDEDRSPVFVQWLDCVYQLLKQYPTCFEFNQRLLLKIAHHTYTCKYGTFLYNCMSQRKALTQKTVSLWSSINRRTHKYVNPFYVPSSVQLEPTSMVARLQFWDQYFMKWSTQWRTEYYMVEPGVTTPEAHLQRLMWQAKSHQEMKNELESEVLKLCRQVERYQRFLKQNGLELNGIEMHQLNKNTEEEEQEESKEQYVEVEAPQVQLNYLQPNQIQDPEIEQPLGDTDQDGPDVQT